MRTDSQGSGTVTALRPAHAVCPSRVEVYLGRVIDMANGILFAILALVVSAVFMMFDDFRLESDPNSVNEITYDFSIGAPTSVQSAPIGK